jgi:hypothetical protein
MIHLDQALRSNEISNTTYNVETHTQLASKITSKLICYYALVRVLSIVHWNRPT